MPIEFWTNEPEDNRSIDEIIKSFDQSEIPATKQNAPIGTKVKPGKDWGVSKGDGYDPATTGNRYLERYKIGTVTEHYSLLNQDWVKVTWENGFSDYYRAGPNLGNIYKDSKRKPMIEAYDLYLYKEPEEVFVTAANRKIGMKVKPSSEFGKWRSGEYGKSYIYSGTFENGIIMRFFDNETFEDWVMVRWDDNREHYYACGSRLGPEQTKNGPQFDLAVAE